MASRRSDSSRTTRTPARTPASPSTAASTQTPAPASGPAAAPGHASASAPTRTSPLTPAHAASAGLAQTPSAKSPVKSPAKAASRGTRKGKAAASSQSVGVPEELRRAMIAEAAYFHAEQRGFAPGAEVEDWLAAEAEVDVLLKASSGMPQ